MLITARPFPRQEKAMLHCDLRARWNLKSCDLRFRAALSEPKNPFFLRDLFAIWLRQRGNRTRKSLAMAIVVTSSSIIRAQIGVFSLSGLTKVTFVPKTSDTTAPSLSNPLKRKNCDAIRHFLARFRLKICYCSWPPIRSGKTDPVQFKGGFNEGSYNGRFASSFLLLGIGFLEASKKANLSFKNPSPKPH